MEENRYTFRAKHCNHWVYGAYKKFLPYTPAPIRDKEPPEKDYQHLIISESFSDWNMPRSLKCFIVDPKTVGQCTGLKDKNGKLIYEGDIVIKKVFIDYQGDGTYQPDVYVDREYIGIVHFSASNGATLQKIKIYETESPYEAKKQRDKRECPKATKLIACRSEVIGNIYDDPDYLETAQKIIESELKDTQNE